MSPDGRTDHVRSPNKIANNAMNNYQMKMTRGLHKFADRMNRKRNIEMSDSEIDETTHRLPI